MDEIVRITIPKFNEYIRIAEKKKLKPFLQGSVKPLPKKYQTEDYRWNNRGQLVYANSGALVASNPNIVGTPRDWRINGQDIYNQKIKHSARASIMQKLHAKFKEHLAQIDNIPEELFPITLRINFYIQDQNKVENREKNIDNDNRWIYHKAIQDTLSELKKIKDDNPYFINGNHHKTYFVDDPEEVRLEIILLKDD